MIEIHCDVRSDMSDPNIVFSGLCQRMTVEGHEIRIEIVKLESDTTWTLEVVNEKGASTVWNDPFDTDEDAMNMVKKVLVEEGISAFLDDGNVVEFPSR